MSTTAELSQALFGDYVDHEVIAKMNPEGGDVHTFGESSRAGTPVLRGRRTGRRQVRKNDTGKKVLAGAGIGATLIGGALGGRELLEQAPKAAKIWRSKAGWVKPAKTGAKFARIPRPGPAARVAGVGGMLAGDAIATGEQFHSMRRNPEAVNKGFEEMVRGIMGTSRLATAVHAPDVVRSTKEFGEHVPTLTRRAEKQGMINANRNPATRSLVQARGGHAGSYEHLQQLRERSSARKLAAVPTQAATKMPKTREEKISAAQKAGQAAQADVGRFMGTTTGKIVAGGAAVGTGVHVLRRRGQGGGAPSYADEPYAYAKRDRKTQDVTFSGTFSKFDDEKRLAFGWANVSKVDGMPVVDRQGDYVSIEDIEEAAYTYVEQSRVGGDMHKRIGGKADGTGDRPHHVADLVESMVFDDAKCESLGLAEDFPRGWWVGFRVFDDDVWEMAKDGRRAGFSIHGKGIRKNVNYDELMGVT